MTQSLLLQPFDQWVQLLAYDLGKAAEDDPHIWALDINTRDLDGVPDSKFYLVDQSLVMKELCSNPNGGADDHSSVK